MKKLHIIIMALFSILFICDSKSQILDVPYRSDMSCGVWCWATSAHMITVYYGNDVYLCDLLELTRLDFPTLFNTSDCCEDPDSCCTSGSLCGSSALGSKGLLSNWGITSTCLYRYLTTTEIQTELTLNRPFIAKIEGHVKVVYGYIGGNLYIHNPGQGSEIISYTDFISGSKPWIQTLTMDSSATTCPLTQHIIGIIKVSATNQVNIYKAQQDIFLSCNIQSSADTEFRAGDDIVFETGFQIDLGGSALFLSNQTVVCP